MAETIWRIERGEGPLVAVAVHAGHALRPEVEVLIALDEAQRLREEDPFTEAWTAIAPTRVVGLRSRFEVDLNRPRERAVHLRPEQAWGLNVWQSEPPAEVVERSLENHDAFYAAMRELFDDIVERHGRFVVFDIHSYNHRREGPRGPAADPVHSPDINLGTATAHRDRWAPIFDRFLEDMRAFESEGRSFGVGENVKFGGGQLPKWVHATYPETGCALAVEVKKFFMDEWTGEPDLAEIEFVQRALAWTIPGVLEELDRL